MCVCVCVQDFLTRQGVVVTPAEDKPVDPYSTTRLMVDKPVTSYATPTDYDKYKQFLLMDRKVRDMIAALLH